MADISALVQESLSVSGILLGKTMGRGAELADRFDKESENLADLEVRSRMAGRWMMSAIQTSFAVMPALVYLFAGLAPGAASIGTIVAFTTLQTRLFFPVQSLLSVAVDIQTSTALFERVFEYLDLNVDIEPGTRDAARRPRRGPLRRRLVPLRRRVDAARRRHHGPRRHAHRAGRRDRRRQDVARLPRGAPVRPRAGRRHDRRHRPARAHLRRAGRRRRRRLPGDLPLPRLRAREPALRQARAPPTRRSRRPPAPPRSTTRSPSCPTATTPSSASAASASPAARSSASRSPARSCATRPCSCSTRPRSALDVATERAVGEALEQLAEGRTTIVIAHRLSHRPRRRPDRRARPAARSPSAAPTKSCSRSAAATPPSSPATQT